MYPRCVVAVLTVAALLGVSADAATNRTMADVLAESKPADWRVPDPEDTLYMDIPSGRVVIELAPQFAPRHAANVRALVREGYFDGLAIVRVQDNYVVQWGDPDETRIPRVGKKTLAAEFSRPAKALPFTVLPDADGFAPQTGFVDGFPAARDSDNGTAWPVHCYAMLGAGRDVSVDSGGGTGLYVVTGHAPRHLDRNITLLGRVIQGMELLSALPRGPAPMGFYQKPGENVSIRRIRVAADVPPAERVKLEVLRTDTATFTDLVESRRNRREDWYKVPAGHIDVCNVPLPVRVVQ